jgi:hypothetical protein
MGMALDEHAIRCSLCGRNLIDKDNVNNGIAFLSHLKIDHGIFYNAQQRTDVKVKKKGDADNQTLAPPE